MICIVVKHSTVLYCIVFTGTVPGGPDAQERVVVRMLLHLRVELRLARQAADARHAGRRRAVQRQRSRLQLRVLAALKRTVCRFSEIAIGTVST